MSEAAKSEGLVLSGLDGSNPLAFLAALGTLRTLTLAWPEREVRMAWRVEMGAWRPVISSAEMVSHGEAELLQGIEKQFALPSKEHPVFQWARFFPLEVNVLRNEFEEVCSSSRPQSRDRADFLSAIGSEMIAADSPDNFDNQMRAARTDYHVGNLKAIVADTSSKHIKEALFSLWKYKDPTANHSLRLDPREDCRYAHQWTEPTSDPSRARDGNVWGANRLAIEGIALLQSMVISKRIKTTGFSGFRSHDTRWTWPIWNIPVSLSVVSSILSLEEIQAQHPDRSVLLQRGIAEIYRSFRLTVNKNKIFTPAQPI